MWIIVSPDVWYLADWFPHSISLAYFALFLVSLVLSASFWWRGFATLSKEKSWGKHLTLLLLFRTRIPIFYRCINRDAAWSVEMSTLHWKAFTQTLQQSSCWPITRFSLDIFVNRDTIFHQRCVKSHFDLFYYPARLTSPHLMSYNYSSLHYNPSYH